ncbi:pyrroloquinoline quinone biosynthesis peptide chaperone PqqD [Zwartia panacis]|uniref:pyrroloquinoline quinone biosynthesis peptide chaperone PqqD n=1 Tax=Zwartia panacis TaxID=2683345 RepID=UPI0025B60E36|nr:pyrroloquinoline quinone biosynthesis peptide chaperone PqqD [Zwartia panacis]MDN4018179.1 pyrroloquinoline quinone biosynthesis peptide chaperone PqqD [Zwartia panacis]
MSYETPESLPERPRLNRLFRLQWEEAQQAYVLLYPEGMVKLNLSAAEILKRCDGEHTLDELISELEQAFGEKDLRDPVEGMLRAAFEKNWIQ